MRKSAVPIILALTLAACSLSATTGRERAALAAWRPPPIWTGVHGVMTVPDSVKVHTGERAVGDVLYESTERYARTVQLVSTFDAGERDRFQAAAGTVLYALRKDDSMGGLPADSKVHDWCVIGATLCFRWYAPGRVRYGPVFIPPFEAPEPQFADEKFNVDRHTQLVIREIRPEGIVAAVLADGVETQVVPMLWASPLQLRELRLKLQLHPARDNTLRFIVVRTEPYQPE